MADKAKVSVHNKEAMASDLKVGNKAVLVYEKKGAKLSALSIYADKR